jgi:glycogen debranching enzyme
MMTTTNIEDRLEQGKYYITADSSYIDDRTHVLNHCDTFGIFNRSGDILPLGKEVQGLYCRDTRYINKLGLKINDLHPTLMSSTVKEENDILSVDLTNPEMRTDSGQLLHHGTIHIKRSQFVRDGLFYEGIEIRNHNVQSHTFHISMEFGGDFKDIFEVRGLKREQRGFFQGYQYPSNRSIVLSYTGLDHVTRKARVTFNIDISEIVNPEEGEIRFDISLTPNELAQINYVISFEEGIKSPQTITLTNEKLSVPGHEKAKAYFATIETSNLQFNHWLDRSKADLITLMADTSYGKYPYAGVPWYNTAFGRDGIITALEVLWIAPALAKDVLLFLASKQSTELDEANDAEPGKILHEMRNGEMVALNEVPFKQYYGTIDATPLFVILAGEYFSRTGDDDTIKKIWPNIVRAIHWINEHGDLDGDGFVEYRHKAKNGLTNQGWKDSHDSVFHRDGQLADPPIALCEVQAYVYRAKQMASKLALYLGEKKISEAWKKEARDLKDKFNEVFWDRQLKCYVLALDGNKKPCRVKSSNAGQVLFTGIADEGKAKQLVQTLMKSDMFNGWGIRTLSSEELRYNPMSYHNGSVWPHDVALIADGMSKYGYPRQAMQLMTGLFHASLFINLQRLPELFCGMEKRKGEGPTGYPVACSPQAWSVAAVFLLLKAVLQIKITPGKNVLSFNKPVLPPYLESLHIKDLSLGEKMISLDITRAGSDTMVGINWNNAPDDWTLNIVK